MNTPNDMPDAEVVPRKRWRIPWVWVVPAVALLIGVWLAAQAVLEKGPTVTITFKSGEGLEAGKTKIKFKDVDIGQVKSVTLSKDYTHVVATADLTRDAANMLVEDTRFWVVRPRVAGGSVSGIGTLLSGAYIGMDIGRTKRDRRDYVGLETPPVFASDVPGRQFVLKASDLGSVDVGTPVFFRRLQVGQVTSFELDRDGSGVTLHVFVNAPYDRYVNADSRFWQAGGIDVTLGTDGLKVNTQSLVSILIGGLAFETPAVSLSWAEAPADTVFNLFATRADALRVQERIVETYVFNFQGSVRGLAVGAPVEFRGIQIGEVSAIYTRFDAATKQISIPVEVKLYPERFTSRFANAPPKSGRMVSDPKALADFLVERGLRGQLRTGSLLTGQLYVAMDFFPAAKQASVDWNRTPPELPTTPSGLDSLQDSINRIMTRIDKLPIEQLTASAQKTLNATSLLMQGLNTDVLPQAAATLNAARSALDAAHATLSPDSGLQQDTAEAVRELTRTAASFRNLADYLQQHPEALLRGKPEEKK